MNRRGFIFFLQAITSVFAFRGFAASDKSNTVLGNLGEQETLEEILKIINMEASFEYALRKNLDALKIEVKRENYPTETAYKKAIELQGRNVEAFNRQTDFFRKAMKSQMLGLLKSNFTSSERDMILTQIKNPLSIKFSNFMNSPNSKVKEIFEYPGAYTRLLMESSVKELIQSEKETIRK